MITREITKKNKIKTPYKESPFKSIIEDIKRSLYYAEKIKDLSTSDIKNIKEKLVRFKNELFKNNNNNNNNNNTNTNNNNSNNDKTKKDLNECKSIKYIRYLLDEDKNKKSNLYKTEKNEK